MNKKYSVLTFIIGDYEMLHEILVMDPEAEYICVTDNPNLKSDTWTIIVDHDLDGLSPFNKCFEIRYNCFKYCHTDICFRIDGSIEIRDNLSPIIDTFISCNYDYMLMIHPYRNNIIDEYNAWVHGRQYPIDQAKKCVSFLSSINYDFETKGLIQLNAAIQKRSYKQKMFDDLTLSILKYLGDDNSIERLDQTVFTAILIRFFKNVFNIGYFSQELVHSKYLRWYFHNSNDEVIYYKMNVIDPYMFGEKVELINFN